MPKDVFISHSSTSAEIAGLLLKRLEEKDVSCWMAPRDLRVGDDWAEGIVEGIDSSKLFLLVLCETANGSPQVKRELSRAVNRNIPILPVIIGDFTLSKSMEYFVSSHHWLKLAGTPGEKDLAEVAAAIHHQLPDVSGEQSPVVADLSSPSSPPTRGRPLVFPLLAVLLAAALGLGGYLFFADHFRKSEVWLQMEDKVEEASYTVPLELGRERYEVGNELVVSCTPPRAGYLTIYSYTEGGDSVTQLFPNRSQPDNHVAADAKVTIPGEGQKYRLMASEDNLGKTLLVALLTPRKDMTFSDLKVEGLFAEIQGEVALRGFVVQEGDSADGYGAGMAVTEIYK